LSGKIIRTLQLTHPQRVYHVHPPPPIHRRNF
jgi:hypothetical protein